MLPGLLAASVEAQALVDGGGTGVSLGEALLWRAK
jgi:hypothetical protein